MAEKNKVKEYSNGEITIVWKPDLCIHSTNCWKGEDGLMDVFNPKERPWINPEGASSERIIQQVKKCPSGALSYYRNEEDAGSTASNNPSSPTIHVEVVKGGPLICKGSVQLKLSDGSTKSSDQITAFCRCGASRNKPYCDGSHNGVENFI